MPERSPAWKLAGRAPGGHWGLTSPSYAGIRAGCTSSSCCLRGCRRGFHGDPTRECRCTGAQIQQYLGRISGPLLDRIDLRIEVPAVAYQGLRSRSSGMSSAEMRAPVLSARALQRQRGHINSEIPAGRIRDVCPLEAAGERTLEMAVRRLGLSARAHDRILKVARRIADLSGGGDIQAKHLVEAVQYRSLDCSHWG